MLEYEAALKRCAHEAAFRAVPVDTFLDALSLFIEPVTLHYQAVEKRREDGQMQGARSTATEAYQTDRRGSEHRATPQMAYRSSFSTACYLWRPQLPDPSDEMVLETALNGHADALATHNVADFAAAAKRFALPLLTPRQLVSSWHEDL
ncbi:hypothetical protein Taqua_01261 [Tepidimonas aquatica]|uniref:Uncharacterized protein n=2 Tax=Tepidimonas aquatica TaxID=247482 RepID=A0A554WN10_9BURK|nr:hypothetical protein Taqua_01261 [Tepidimonas aquatica]